MQVNQLMKKFVENGQILNEEITNELNQLILHKDVQKRSEFIDALFLYSHSVVDEKRMYDLRYSVSNIYQATQDVNKKLYKGLKWDLFIPNKELIHLLDYGISVSERLYKLQTYKLVFYNFLIAVVIFTFLMVFKLPFEKALLNASIFFIIDIGLLVFIRSKNMKNMSRLEVDKGVSKEILEFVNYFKQ